MILAYKGGNVKVQIKEIGVNLFYVEFEDGKREWVAVELFPAQDIEAGTILLANGCVRSETSGGG